MGKRVDKGGKVMTHIKAGGFAVLFIVVIALVIPWWMGFMDHVLNYYTEYGRWVRGAMK